MVQGGGLVPWKTGQENVPLKQGVSEGGMGMAGGMN